MAVYSSISCAQVRLTLQITRIGQSQPNTNVNTSGKRCGYPELEFGLGSHLPSPDSCSISPEGSLTSPELYFPQQKAGIRSQPTKLGTQNKDQKSWVVHLKDLMSRLFFFHHYHIFLWVCSHPKSVNRWVSSV